MKQSNLVRLVTFVSMGIFYLAVPNARPDFTRFQCNDSESYCALAYGMVHGLGYTRSMIPGSHVPHSTIPPGLPLLLTPALAISGKTIDWLVVKWTISIIGLSGIVLTWFLVRDYSKNLLAADLAALSIGLNPYYWDFSHQAMAEIPLTVWMIGGALLMERSFARPRSGHFKSAVVGILCGAGMLIKGHVLGLILVPLAHLSSRNSRVSRRELLLRWFTFCLAFSLPFFVWTWRSGLVDAKGFEGVDRIHSMVVRTPNDPESELLTLNEMAAQIAYKLRIYVPYILPTQIVPGLWVDSFFEWKGSGWFAILITLGIVLVCLPSNQKPFGLHLVVLPPVALNIIYVPGGSSRYWFPVSMIILILLVVRLADKYLSPLTRRKRAYSFLFVSIGVANLGFYVVEHERRPYYKGGPWTELVALFETVREMDLETSGVFTTNCHAFSLMTGKVAPMPVREIAPRYEHMISRLDGVGPQPPRDARLMRKVDPWALFALPRPMKLEELIGEGELGSFSQSK